MPGEMDWDKRNKALATGEIEITGVMAENYQKISDLFGLELHIEE